MNNKNKGKTCGQSYDNYTSSNFTQYRLWNVSGFRSTYSIRIYQLLKEHYGKKIYTFEFLLDDFKKMILGRNAGSYTAFKRFRVRVINTAQKELSERNKQTGLYKNALNHHRCCLVYITRLMGLVWKIMRSKYPIIQ